ncbi:MAG: hypothetical protein ACOCWR_05745, partial [Oceanidesulfovibrio sp.]
RLVKLPVGDALDMRTYKRNRSVVLHKTGDDSFTAMQDGYEQAVYRDVSAKKLKKLLKTLLKKEFPRSTKIRLYTLEAFDPTAERPRMKEL